MLVKLIGVCLLLAFHAQARPRIAIINSQVAITETVDGQNAARMLEEKFRQCMRRIESQGLTGAPEHRRQIEVVKREIEEEKLKVLQDLANRLVEVVSKFAARKRYELVVDVSDPKAAVMWFRKSSDITKEVVAEYNRMFAPPRP